GLSFQPPAGLNPVQIAVNVKLEEHRGVIRRPTSRRRLHPSKLIPAKSSASTNASITRTGLLSSMKSSRHSGNSVHCPRSASSTKRLIDSPIESRENHNSSSAFLHSQGHLAYSVRRARLDVFEQRHANVGRKSDIELAGRK